MDTLDIFYAIGQRDISSMYGNDFYSQTVIIQVTSTLQK